MSPELDCCTTEKISVKAIVHHHSHWAEEMSLSWLVEFGWYSIYDLFNDAVSSSDRGGVATQRSYLPEGQALI
jgi:hypothetical protein